MKSDQAIGRRGFLGRIAAFGGALFLSGCDRLTQTPPVTRAINAAEQLTRSIQRALFPATSLAPEYAEADISSDFRANGSTDPDDDDYVKVKQNDFAGWRLEVSGLVDKPLSLSLGDLRGLPAREQITRHDCVEGWSSIGKWKGPPLKEVLDRAGLKPEAKYIVFRCADSLEPSLDGAGKYYESIDLIDAYHPQTILAYDMNGKPLPVAYGAPLRLRVERQLGYKMAKYIMRIEVVDAYDKIAGGNGGYWEDRGYEWYAGI